MGSREMVEDLGEVGREESRYDQEILFLILRK